MSSPTPIYKTRYDRQFTLLNNNWFSTKNEEVLKLADDTDIPEITDATEWSNATGPAYCWYNNTTDEEFREKYGPIYNGYCISSGLKIPANARHVGHFDWTDLYGWLIANGYNWDGTTEENKIAKAMASSGGEWASWGTVGRVGNDQGSNNAAGLNFLPAGIRTSSAGSFLFFGERVNYFSTGGNIHRLQHDRDLAQWSNNGSSWVGVGASARIVITARKITFEPNGGTSIDDAFWFDDDTIDAPEPPTKAGFNFAGWYSDEALTTEWDFATDTVTEDVTLYAKWVEKEGRKKKKSFRFGFGFNF